MANQKNNQQFKRTEEKMKKTTLKLMEQFPFDQITVRRICEAAQVNRSTFYAHFVDVHDLQGKIELALRLELEDSYKNNPMMQTGVAPFSPDSILIFIRYIYAHRAFYHALLKNDRNFSLQQYEPYWNRVFIFLRQRQPVLSKEEMTYYQMGFQGCFLMIMRKWLENDCRESEEQMVRILTGCVPEVWHNLTKHYFCESSDHINLTVLQEEP